MGIPIGQTYTSTMTGSMLKPVTCESCRTEYCYRVQRSASGQGSSVLFLDNAGASSRAEAAAQKSLERSLEKAVDPVPCPACGFFQKNMVSMLKLKRLYWSLGIGLVTMVVLIIVSFIDNDIDMTKSMYFNPALFIGAMGVVLGVGLYVMYDPNRGHAEGGGRRPEVAETSRGQLREDLEAQHAERNAILQDKLYNALRTSMLMMASADGHVDDEELKSIINIYQQVTETQVAPDVLRAEAAQLAGKRKVLHAQLAELAPDLEFEGKAMFIRAVLVVAAADGNIDDTEWNTIADVGRALRMSTPELKAVIAEMTSG